MKTILFAILSVVSIFAVTLAAPAQSTITLSGPSISVADWTTPRTVQIPYPSFDKQIGTLSGASLSLHIVQNQTATTEYGAVNISTGWLSSGQPMRVTVVSPGSVSYVVFRSAVGRGELVEARKGYIDVLPTASFTPYLLIEGSIQATVTYTYKPRGGL